jgi:phosphate transport system protein
MRNKFDEQLDHLKTQMIQMGALCEEAIASATKALINGDIELAKKVITTDEDIDHKEKEIESICLKLLLTVSAGCQGFAADFFCSKDDNRYGTNW